jgi:GNAT superfamily N-acetyltransferase
LLTRLVFRSGLQLYNPWIGNNDWRLAVRPVDQPIGIENLANHPEWVALLARWHVAEWQWLNPGWTPEIAAAELRKQTDPSRIPTTLVAMAAGEPVGSVSLLAEDLAGWEHLTPWLASLYVRQECRGRGIGKQLVRYALTEAQRMHVAQMYLFTPAHREFYTSLGWGFVTEAIAAGRAVTVMSFRLDGPTT